jgi:hypothetical protein
MDRTHPPDRGWLRFSDSHDDDVAVKPAVYLPIYEELMRELRDERFTLLELGIWKGDSLAMWRDCFPHAMIVGIDLMPPDLDLGPRVKIVQGDQTDGNMFTEIRAAHAPDGFAVIIDDASHIGQLSARSLQALYRQHLQPGGLYVIEDWGTGYVTTWPDGGRAASIVGTRQLDAFLEPAADAAATHRMPSHDTGLVGLIKRLVDHTASGTLSVHQPGSIDDPLPIEWMRIHDGLVILKKPDASAKRVDSR